MNRIKRAPLDRSNIVMMRRWICCIALMNRLYRSKPHEETERNRPLFFDIEHHLVFCYNKWTIASESVDDFSGIRILRENSV